MTTVIATMPSNRLKGATFILLSCGHWTEAEFGGELAQDGIRLDCLRCNSADELARRMIDDINALAGRVRGARS